MSLYRTYRPQTFKEVTGQHHVVTPIRHQLETDTVAHAYLFSGPRGIGKTTIARLLAKAVNCADRKGAEPCEVCPACRSITEGSAMDVIEIDAASHTGVDNVRENVIENVRFAPTQLAKKVFIVDEVHMLSKGAFNALLKTLEEPPSYAMFILATTELHKIPDTIVSRCQRYDFTNVPAELLTDRLDVIAKREGVHVDTLVLEEIARRSGGHVRDAISLLEQVLTLDAKSITAERARVVMPIVDVEQTMRLLTLLVSQTVDQALHCVHELIDTGAEPARLVGEIVQLMRLALLQRIGGGEDKGYTQEQQADLRACFTDVSISRIKQLLDLFLSAQTQYKEYSYHLPQLGIELAIIDACDGVQIATLPLSPIVEARPAVIEAPQEVTPVVIEKKSVVVPTVEAVRIDADPKAETVPGEKVTFEIIKRYWSTFQKTVRERHASLPLALELAEPIRVDGGRAIIKVKFEFYAETVNQPKNNHLLAGILTEVVGENVGIQAIFSNVEQDPQVTSVLEAFGGTVVS
ncbi:hypothetical protein COV06_01080 [Candidatus Uhrbacteria bacterium CG10_big_fil_rev_8_21_14_0_10_50_16]|uniref:DNA polymerase III subunit gamma/tau n=1 Tax=Candidatus Uhrbacteria bacterium CG10_big_fil_rev_8_21_14_0_10_50_16 TaxID=1975039 RepID=A0A2H0RNG3_9BACT|nr:MAG: hypothetical protein COV06_01080 [Candidatus Uhrbacteria bacterium CG10_big_fil_rev_8_21_14_0_10_50_16]